MLNTKCQNKIIDRIWWNKYWKKIGITSGEIQTTNLWISILPLDRRSFARKELQNSFSFGFLGILWMISFKHLLLNSG